MYKRNEGKYLIVFRIKGGDGGYSHEKLEFCSYTPPRHIEVLFTESGGSDFECSESLEYKFQEDLNLIIIEKYRKCSNKKDSLIFKKQISLDKMF